MTRTLATRTPTLRLLLGTLLALAAMLVPTTTARAAEDDCIQSYIDDKGELQYRNVCTGGDDGGGNGGGSSEPPCYLGRVDSFNYDVAYCSGELSCYRFIPSPSSPEPADWPERPAGTPETAQYGTEACFTQPPEEALVSYEGIWVEPETVDPAVYLWDAIGRLALPAPQVSTNPAAVSVVTIPTWWWAPAAATGPVQGTSAMGLVAVATPASMEVDPGDGSGTVTCPWSTTRSDTCSTTYTRSSARQTTEDASGVPAYEARVRLVYDLSFTFQGSPLTLPGAPATVASDWAEVLVPVAEIQTVVTR